MNKKELEESVAELKHRLQEATTRNRDLIEENLTNQEKLHELNKALISTNNRNSELMLEIGKWRAARDSLMAETNKLREENHSLKRETSRNQLLIDKLIGFKG